jgi:CHRD domain-containing protein
MRRRAFSITAVALLGAVVVAIVGAFAMAGEGSKNFRTKQMSSYFEVPSVSTTATGRFSAELSDDGQTLRFELTYSGLSSATQAAHIHFGQKDVNGGVSAFLCGGGGKPACPASGTVTGTVVAADVIGPSGQGIAAGEFQELLAAMRAGVTYANVHTTNFTGGELRGQIGRGGGDDGDGDGD